jgi:hypothetical protein
MFACSEAVAGALQCPDKLTPKICENLILCKKQQQPLLMSNFHISQMWKKKKKKLKRGSSGMESLERTIINFLL